MNKTALITGIFGQDGSYLAEQLSAQGYAVHGVARTPLSAHAQKIRAHLASKGLRPCLHECDLDNAAGVTALLRRLMVDECYHMAASHRSSHAAATDGPFDHALYAPNVMPALNLLAAISVVSPRTRIVLAGSCLMFAGACSTPQNEATPFAATSMYGVAKTAIAELARYYREQHGLHASMAILYNHESPRRRDDFVTRTIVRHLVRIASGEISDFELDNLHAVRDWGYAKDYALAMSLMAAREQPGDFVLATGTGRTVEDFLSAAAGVAGIRDWRDRVRVSDASAAHAGGPIVGDASEAERLLGWRHSMTFGDLVALMVHSEQQGRLD